MPKSARIMFLYPNERSMSLVPPSIALLSKLLKDAGHSVSLFDTTFYEFDDEIAIEDSDLKNARDLTMRPVNEEPPIKKSKGGALEGFRAAIRKFAPDLIAVSCTETTFLRGLKMITAVQDLGIPNCFGGIFPTSAPHLVMKYKEVGMICVGEGENAIVDLADRIAHGENYSNVTNLWVRLADGTIRRNPTAPLVDINKLPVGDMTIFDDRRFYRPMKGRIYRLFPIETHRGCPYRCSFCNSPMLNTMYGGGSSFFRKKSIDLVMREIEICVNKWKAEYIYFYADTFLILTMREIDEFCERYSNFKLPFWCQTRIETINEEKLKKLKSVGLHQMTFGMEHGNEAFRRDIIKREYLNKDAVERLRIPAVLDIPFTVNNIIGFPDETRKLAFDTIGVNRCLKSDTVGVSVFVPFHGTRLRKLAEKKGYISPDTICSTTESDESLLTMPQWDRKDIYRLRKVFTMYVKFPKSRWPEIARAETDPELYAKLHMEYMNTFWPESK